MCRPRLELNWNVDRLIRTWPVRQAYRRWCRTHDPSYKPPTLWVAYAESRSRCVGPSQGIAGPSPPHQWANEVARSSGCSTRPQNHHLPRQWGETGAARERTPRLLAEANRLPALGRYLPRTRRRAPRLGLVRTPGQHSLLRTIAKWRRTTWTLANPWARYGHTRSHLALSRSWTCSQAVPSSSLPRPAGLRAKKRLSVLYTRIACDSPFKVQSWLLATVYIIVNEWQILPRGNKYHHNIK